MHRLAAIAGFIILFVSCAYAVGKVTVDPNTGGSVAGQPDLRVQQMVTCEAKKQPVYRILADLSSKTGVTLTAGINDQDWQVRERPMTIFVKDVTLQELMDSIARTMRFRWKTEGAPAEPRYRLYMDRRAVLLYEAQRKRDANYAATMRQKARENLLGGLQRAATTPGDQLRSSDPYSYLLARSGMATALARLFEICPETQEAFASGKMWIGRSDTLSADARKAVLDVLRGQGDLRTRSTPLPMNLAPDDIEMLIVDNGDCTQGEVIANIGISYYDKDGMQSEALSLLDPTSAMATLMAERQLALEDARPEDQAKIKDDYSKRVRSITAPDWATASDDSSEPIAEHPNDPELMKAIDLKLDGGKSYTREELEELVAEKCGLNVVAESYVEEFPSEPSEKLEVKTAGDLLNLLQDELHCNWWKHGSIVEVRARQWYEARQSQIPEAWLERWRQIFRSAGTLDIDYLSEMAALTWPQIVWNVLCDRVLTCGKGHNSALARALQPDSGLGTYGKLTRRQRAYTYTERGLDLMAIPDWQSRFGTAEGAAVPDGSKLIFRSRKRAKGKAWEYTFEFDFGEESNKETLKLTTPLFVEPAKTAMPASGSAAVN